MAINVPETNRKRIVIVGAGFAGLILARKLTRLEYQVVLVDKNNYHQFQPLFYQVAMAGLEPSSISFPLRKVFQRKKNIHIRITEVTSVDTKNQKVFTPLGFINYDYLVLSLGADTNFFGNEHIAKNCIPMKSVSEALFLRNSILDHYEKALTTRDFDQRQSYVDIVIVGGGPTGVEVAGALAEMRNYVLPKDYPELDHKEMDIYLVQSGDRLLPGMSEQASAKARKFLEQLGVIVKTETRVTGFDGDFAYTNTDEKIQTKKVIWAAGIKGNLIDGLPEEVIARGSRISVNEFNQIKGIENVYAIGDLASMVSEKNPYGHPQVAQVALQQGKNLAYNFKMKLKGKPLRSFKYNDKGSMATIGRHRAVVDLPRFRFQGFFAWFVWMFIHLVSLIGFKNKLIVFLNWFWNYFTYDQSLRLIIKPSHKRLSEKEVTKDEEIILKK